MKILRDTWKKVYIPAGIRIELDEPLECWIREHKPPRTARRGE